MASRRIEHLHPDLIPLCRRFLFEAKELNIDIILTCTYRSNEEQEELYASGRTKKGPILTLARAGQSAHNYMLNGKPASKAFDIAFIEAGKAIWDIRHPSWEKLGQIGISIGLDWYGKPGAKFREYPHFQMRA